MKRLKEVETLSRPEAQIIELVRGEEAPAAKSDGGEPAATPIPQQAVFAARAEVHAITVARAVETYIVDLVFATRYPERHGDDLKRWIQVGVSPRGALALDKCSRAHAWLADRDHVTPDDVRAIAPECLRHRILLGYEANADGKSADDVVAEVLKQVAVA